MWRHFGLEIVGVRNVAGEDGSLGLQGARKIGQRLVVDVGQDKAGAFSGKAFRSTPAEAAGGTRDQHRCSVKTAHFSSPGFFRSWCR